MLQFSIGKTLGNGSFCTVKEANVIHGSQSKQMYFALKQARIDLSYSDRRLAEADIQKEIITLCAVQHPNIISIFDVGDAIPDSILMERLKFTLHQQIVMWNTEKRNLKRKLCKYHLSKLWNQQLTVLSDIGNAMQYLHDQGLIHRDLKPENCGFDSQGKIKLFDFGLAANIEIEEKTGPDQYQLGQVGTLRYMAPEVALGKSSGKSADVYSFALLFWETISLGKPFTGMTSKTIVSQVFELGKRPKMPKKWPKRLKAILHKSWDANPVRRLSFSQICSEVDKLREIDCIEKRQCKFAWFKRIIPEEIYAE